MNLKQIKNKLNNQAEEVFKKLGMKCEVFGDNIYSTCPIHEGSDNPRAFSFSVDKGIWKCWTRDCQHECGNDIFGVIRGALSAQSGEELEFKDALRWACQNFNIKGNYKESKTETKDEPEELDLASALALSINKKVVMVKDSPIEISCDLQVPSSYFNSRGFKKSTLKYFGVGDCCDNGALRERAVIPIHNDTGKMIIGSIARSTKEYRSPKFLIHPKGFDKRCYFYNFHRAIKKASEKNCLYILEGQGDVWKMHESGVKNAVSIFGKTISKEQEAKLRQLPVTHLVILMDNDQAGREARISIQRQLGRTYRLTFPRLTNKDIGDMSVKNIKENILIDLEGTY